MVHVADRVQPVAAGDSQAVVDVEPGAGLEADRVEAEVVRVGHTAGGEEDLVGLDAVAGVGEGHHGGALARHRGHRGAARTSAPASFSDSATSSPAKGSMRAAVPCRGRGR